MTSEDTPLDRYDTIATLGRMVWWATQLVLFVAWMIVWTRWLGGVGFIVGMLFSPTVMLFPIAYWVANDTFPLWHLILWFIGFGGLIVNGWAQPRIGRP